MKKSWLFRLAVVFTISGAVFLWSFRSTVYGAFDDPTIREKCQSQIGEQYWSVCCRSPDYWNNPACPYQKKSQDLNYDGGDSASDIPARQFGSPEENHVYQWVLSCFKNGGSQSSCTQSTAKQTISEFLSRNPECVKIEINDENAQLIENCKQRESAWVSRVNQAGGQAYRDWEAAQKKNESPLESLTDKFPAELLGSQQNQEVQQQYEALEPQAVSLPQIQVSDSRTNPAETDRLEKGSDKSVPALAVDYGLNNVRQGQPVSATMPEGSPVSKLLLSSAQNVNDGVLNIEVYDTGKPVFLRAQEQLPPPDPNIYKNLNYLHVESNGNSWSQAFFEFMLPLMPDNNYTDAAMLRWNQERKNWDSLPTTKLGCDATNCRFISRSPGTSYFAIVVKKDTIKWRYVFGGAAFWGSIIYLLYARIKSKFRKNTQQNKKQVCRFCRSVISGEAIRCPRCTADLRRWPGRHPVFMIIIVTILASLAGRLLESIR